MYSYKEGAAGKLRSRRKTGKTSEALLAQEEIVSLAKELLSTETHREAEELSKMLVGTEAYQDAARSRLITIVQTPPKRPMYYCQHEVQFLPDWTRNTMRYLGDFVDMLVKAAVYEKTQDRRIFRSSFGPAIAKFKEYIPEYEQLACWLRRYNQFLYRDAKHYLKPELPANRKEHRFYFPRSRSYHLYHNGTCGHDYWNITCGFKSKV